VSAAKRQPLVDAPAFLQRWHWRVLLALVLLVPFFVPIPRELQNHPVWAGFGDRLHVILLGGTTLFLYWFGPLRGHLLRSVLGAAVIGGLIELLQLLVGRHALWHDFFQDLIGIGIVLGFVTWRGAGSRIGLVLMCSLVVLVPWQMREIPRVMSAKGLSAERFPLLADFETERERWLWSDDYDAEVGFAARADGTGTALILRAPSKGLWPAAVHGRFPADWSNYDELVMEVRLVESAADSVRAVLAVQDYEGYRASRSIRRSFHATNEWRTVALRLYPLEDPPPRGELDLQDVFSLRVMVPQPEVEAVLAIDNLRLR
jgi:hypothetical protein